MDDSRPALVQALLDHSHLLSVGATQLTPIAAADQFLKDNPFAFLTAVIADMGIKAERAWALPYLLSLRLGHLDPKRLAASPEEVQRAIAQSPTLHRFVVTVPRWISIAASIVVNQHDGDASQLWNDEPTAIELQARLRLFPGIGQKKAAMAVEVLAQSFDVRVRELVGSDVAYDVHVRRVFLRTGLVARDDATELIKAARQAYPERPGALDLPAWDIGRHWCHPSAPHCSSCPLTAVCPKLISAAQGVEGI